MDIILYGATGFTGKLVAHALRQRRLAFAISGRDSGRLEALARQLGETEVRVAQVHRPTALRDAFSSARLVINCAGPFSQLGEPVVRAAIASGAHYIDISDEQRFMRTCFEHLEASARKAGVAVINGLAFTAALGDWAATLAASLLPAGGIDELSVSYALDQFRSTRGTQLSAIANLADGGCAWNEDRWENVATAAELRPIAFPPPTGMREGISFPSGECITIPRHLNVKKVQTFLSVAGDTPFMRLVARATSVIGPALPILFSSPLVAFARAQLSSAGPGEPTVRERNQSRFAILARAEQSFTRRQVAVSGTDPYGVTAEIVAHCSHELLTKGPAIGGVLAPSQAFDAQATLGAVASICDLEVQHT